MAYFGRLRTTLEFEFLSQHKASHLNMTCWRGSGWPIPVLGAASRRATGVPYLCSTIPSLGYEVTSSFLSLLFFSVFLLPLYLCQSSLGPSRHQGPKSRWLTLLTNMNSVETALSRLLCALICCPMPAYAQLPTREWGGPVSDFLLFLSLAPS